METKEILNKIGQLQYEISLLELDKETLTGVTIRTDELKALVSKNESLHIVSQRELLIEAFDLNNILDGDREKIAVLVDITLKSINGG